MPIYPTASKQRQNDISELLEMIVSTWIANLANAIDLDGEFIAKAIIRRTADGTIDIDVSTAIDGAAKAGAIAAIGRLCQPLEIKAIVRIEKEQGGDHAGNQA